MINSMLLQRFDLIILLFYNYYLYLLFYNILRWDIILVLFGIVILTNYKYFTNI